MTLSQCIHVHVLCVSGSSSLPLSLQITGQSLSSYVTDSFLSTQLFPCLSSFLSLCLGHAFKDSGQHTPLCIEHLDFKITFQMNFDQKNKVKSKLMQRNYSKLCDGLSTQIVRHFAPVLHRGDMV